MVAQSIPLPLGWIERNFPLRADLERSLVPLGLAHARTALSVAPSLTRAHLARVLCYICVFLAVRELTIRAEARAWRLAIPPAVIGFALAALGLIQYFTTGSHASGTYVNPNHYACFLGMTLPLPLVLAGSSRRGYPARAAFAVCAATIFLGAVYSLSRMAVAAMMVSVLFTIVLGGSGFATPGRRYILATAAAAALIVFAALSVPGALLHRFSENPVDVEGGARIRIWRETLHMAADYRLFGSGLGTFASAFQRYRTSSPMYLVDYAHNDYLQLMAELGILGLAAVSGAVLAVGREIFRAIGSARDRRNRLLAAACAAGLLALAVDSFVDFDFYVPANAMLAAWLAGIGSGTAFSSFPPGPVPGDREFASRAGTAPRRRWVLFPP